MPVTTCHRRINCLSPAESQPEWEDFIDAEDYLNDEHKFNITHILVLRFPRIDVNPSDGFVTEHELTEWNLEQSQREVLHRNQREMELHDKNHDGLVSFAEYQPPTWVHNNSFGYDMGWWKKVHFNAYDVDGDGFLNITEFNDFVLQLVEINTLDYMSLIKVDTDKDGRLSLTEMIDSPYNEIMNSIHADMEYGYFLTNLFIGFFSTEADA
uniref:EF-hand domain-containing protein n=1 Tax=Lactuca sativa TaxID=4236 RepID=A0A9R1W3E8_LACSA|nr:hypothetical protein LSAT_V11C300122250 [Lactuca sativa]